jgi:hypothetical protein
MTFTIQDEKLRAGNTMKSIGILLLFVAIGLLLLAGKYRPVQQEMSPNCVSYWGRNSFKDPLLLAQAMTETFFHAQVVKTYLKMFNAKFNNIYRVLKVGTSISVVSL